MFLRYLFIFLSVFFLSGCDVMFRQLKEVGRPPTMQEVNVYNDATEQNVVQQNHSNFQAKNNSLWEPETKSFLFREDKAKKVGDILKVKVTISDKAKLDNKTSTSRDSKSKFGMPGMFGLQSQFKKINKDINPSSLIHESSKSGDSGSGKIDRKEVIETTVAATIIKVLPNGNLLIRGTQEIRVNFELREIFISGIIRPEDISSDNSVELSQIAEARVSYGGKGQITQYQQPPYGKQVLDILSPF